METLLTIQTRGQSVDALRQLRLLLLLLCLHDETRSSACNVDLLGVTSSAFSLDTVLVEKQRAAD